MLSRFRFAVTILLGICLSGCGGNDEVKKNEGTLVHTMPTAGTPGGGNTTPGTPAAGTANAPPPIPPIKE